MLASTVRQLTDAPGLPSELVRSIPNRHALAHLLLPPRPFYLFSAAQFGAADPSATLMHSHPCVCLHGCLGGAITLVTEHGDHHLKAGSFFLIAPGVAHAWRNDSGRAAMTVGLWLEPSRDEAAGPLDQLVRRLHRFDVAGDDELHSVYWHVADHLLTDRPRHPLATTGLLLALSGLLVERLQDVPAQQRPHSEAVDAIREFLLRRLSSPPQLAEVARRVGLSGRQAERLFRAVHGVSIMAFFNRERIARGQRLLSSGRYTVEEVSHQLGYSSPAHFSRAFRQHTGDSPGRFRRRLLDH